MQEILNTFLLANIPEIITQEEFDDVKNAIFKLLEENKTMKLKIKTMEHLENCEYETIVKNTIDYVKDCLEHLCPIDEIELLNKLGLDPKK